MKSDFVKFCSISISWSSKLNHQISKSINQQTYVSGTDIVDTIGPM